MNKIFISGILLLAFVMPAAAQTTSSAAGVRGGIRDLRERTQNAIKDIRTGLSNAIQQERSDFKQQVDAMRVRAQGMIAAKKAEFQTELQKIKDVRKKEIVSRLNDRIIGLNDNWANRFSDVLGKLEAVLARIKDRAAKVAAGGVDISVVQSAIQTADQAIGSAKTLVTAQSGKVYSVTITSESTVKTDIQQVRDALHADLVAVRDSVQAARDAVHTAATTLAGLRGEHNEESATSTGTSTNP